MNASEYVCRPRSKRSLWFVVGLGVAGALTAGAAFGYRGGLPAWWGLVGLVAVVVGAVALYQVTARVAAGAYGVHSWTLLRRRSVPWHDIAELLVRVKTLPRGGETRRVVLAMRDGRRRTLPQPASSTPGDEHFATQLSGLREVHRRHGGTEPGRLRVVTDDAAGSGWVSRLCASLLLLAAAGAVAFAVPGASAYERQYQVAQPCAAGLQPTGARPCLRTVPAVITRTEPHLPKRQSWLYFAGGGPSDRLAVSREAAEAFRAGDRVELTVFRGEVMKVAGERYVWTGHVITGGSLAVFAAGLVLLAGLPGAQVLRRLRGRRLPDDERLPSALPFTGVLAGTAVWLLPLCYLHPTTPLGSAQTITWWAVGSLVTAGLLTWAWHVTRIRVPGESAPTRRPEAEDAADGDVFLAARFLEDTDYNPYGFGTHIVLGNEGPAVTPHPGPGRFGAKSVPVERLTVKNVRRARGADGDGVPGDWHVAELDDAGTPVRLAAAPDDLARIIHALALAKA
ncbi:PH domain-containing protein [Streptomyces sp. MUM 16J]|uniref:PH domain-containing protein n=1 Tax=Streptomyces sp. MUM 16J TaxID=2791988 RepID=UPI001F04A55B|nr:PH domain-containing protein [Streptomyces sp. MUM 16J]MCH0559738.1 PH domain-containing protein [Streptomyces sp. MUM 16J]